MTNKKYPGYPQYVIITLPKCGTKSMNKCFTTLGYKGKLSVLWRVCLQHEKSDFIDYRSRLPYTVELIMYRLYMILCRT